MPRYNLTTAWSDPIPVQAGDYVQNPGGNTVEICAITPADSADAVKIPKMQAVLIENATQIRGRSVGTWNGAQIVVARGL